MLYERMSTHGGRGLTEMLMSLGDCNLNSLQTKQNNIQRDFVSRISRLMNEV